MSFKLEGGHNCNTTYISEPVIGEFDLWAGQNSDEGLPD